MIIENAIDRTLNLIILIILMNIQMVILIILKRCKSFYQFFAIFFITKKNYYKNHTIESIQYKLIKVFSEVFRIVFHLFSIFSHSCSQLQGASFVIDIKIIIFKSFKSIRTF